MMAQTTPEQRQAGMGEWMKWAEANGDSLVDFGAPLGTGNHVEPGSVSPGTTKATGFSILEADSLDAATKMVQDHPHFHTPGATIDVIELLPAQRCSSRATPMIRGPATTT
jgi:hypothetical protein